MAGSSSPEGRTVPKEEEEEEEEERRRCHNRRRRRRGRYRWLGAWCHGRRLGCPRGFGRFFH